MKIIIPISVGELLDKISILQIKIQHTNSQYVEKEILDLIEIAKKHSVYDSYYMKKLISINKKLWKIEDDLRDIEKTKIFTENFIELARSVYLFNDKRALIKKEINEKYNSQYQEVKCYA